MNNTRKIVVIGSGNVGKSRIVRRFANKPYYNNEKKYCATMGVEVYPAYTNGYKFNLWDTAGKKKWEGLLDGYYIGSNGAICIIDIDDNKSIDRADYFIATYIRVCPETPILIINITKKNIGNKENTYNCVDDIPIEILFDNFK